MLIAPAVMFVAYFVLAVAGFGSALISIPLLALFLPVKLVIPAVLLVDFIATAGTGLRFRRDIALDELKPIIVPMMLGLAAGVTLLVQLPARWVLLALGLFIFGYGAYNLFAHASQRRYSKWWSLPVGLSGPLRPYSIVMPGITNASAVGFMMSIMTATAIVSSSPTWARLIGASSRALTRICDARRALVAAERG